MLNFNDYVYQQTGIKPYLNTSHVKLQPLPQKPFLIRLNHLNTSHVKLQLRPLNGSLKGIQDLNTSHVKLQRNTFKIIRRIINI